MKKFLILLLASAAVCIACDKNDPKDNNEPFPEPIDVPFVEYSLEGTESEWKNLDDYNNTGTLITINSSAELGAYISGTDYPAVDFSRKTLLLAHGVGGYLIASIDMIFQQIAERKYLMNVQPGYSISPSATPWQVAIVIDKLQSDDFVELNVIYPQHSRTTYAGTADYYWYQGEKKYLTISTDQVNVITADSRLQKSSSAKAALSKRSGKTKYVLPYLERGEGIEPVGTSDIFYLKLKSASDLEIL